MGSTYIMFDFSKSQSECSSPFRLQKIKSNTGRIGIHYWYLCWYLSRDKASHCGHWKFQMEKTGGSCFNENNKNSWGCWRYSGTLPVCYCVMIMWEKKIKGLRKQTKIFHTGSNQIPCYLSTPLIHIIASFRKDLILKTWF